MVGEPLGQMIIELGLDSSSFGKGLDGAKKATRYAMAEMKSNMAVMGQAGNKYEALKAKQVGLTKVIEAQTKEVIALKKAYDGSLVDGKPTAQTAKLATQLQNANGKLGSFNTQLVNNAKNMAMVKVQTTGMTGAINNVGQAMTSSGAKLSSVGGSMTRNFTAPIVAGMGYATKSAIDFDSQISQMGPLLTNGGKVTAQFKHELDAMAESSKKWSKQYGVSTTEINNGMSELIKRGFTSQQVMGSMPSILDATKASGEEMGVVMQATASIVEQFGLKTNSTAGTMKNTQRVTDSLTYAANATAAGFGDMSEAMSYVGPVASSLGLSVEQTAAAVGELSNQGIEGQKAGTNLRGILTSLIKPTKQNTKGFESMGISAKQLAHDSHDLPQLIDDITKGTAGWKNAERGKALAQAFGRENQAAANALVKAGSSSLRELTTETQNATGATKKVAEQMNGTKANQIKRFQESLHVLAIEAGEKLLPTLMPIVEDATKMVDSFSKLDSATQQNILRTGLWIAAAGPVTKIAGSSIKSIGALATGYVDLSAKMEGFMAGRIVKRELSMAQTATETLATTTTKSAGTMTRDMVNWSNSLGRNSLQAKSTFSGLGETMGTTAGKAGLMGAMMSPLGLTIIGVTAAVGLGITAWELWGKQAYASMASTAKWGTNVSDEADKSLAKMQGFSTGVSNALDGFANKSEATTKVVASNFDGMYRQLKTDSKQSLKKMQSDIDNLPTFAKNAAEKDLANKKKTNAEVVADARVQNQTVQTLLKKHNGDVQSLSDDEKQIVLNARTRINADELKLLQIGGKAKMVVLETLNGDVSKLSKQRHNQDILDLSNQYTKEKKIYENQAASIKKAYKDGAISADTYKKSMKELESSHKSSVDNMAAATLKLDRANGKSKDEIIQDLGVYETSYKRAAEIVDGQTKKMSKSTSLIAADTNSMSKETAKANEQWNKLIFDPKTGKVKTNAQEEITKAAQSKKGWDNLYYDLKHANLSSNAKQMISNAAIESGNWNKLTWKEQKALIKTNSSEIAVKAMTDAGTWDKLSFQQKEAIVNSNSKQASAQAIMDSGQWNSLSWEQQDAVVVTNLGQTIMDSLKMNDTWNNLTFEQQRAIVSSNSKDAVKDAIFASTEWNDLPWKEQLALVKTNSAKVAAESLKHEDIWNKLSFDQQKAVLSSNSKEAVAQAVMDSGQWNRLTWEQQDALVATNAGRTIMDVLSAKGTWDKLSFDQQKAIVSSNSKEVIIQAVMDAGQWNTLSFKQQKAMVENKASKEIMQALQDAGTWNKLDVKTQKAVIESKGLPQLADSVIQMQNWNQIPADMKKLLVNDADAKQKLIDAGVDIAKYDNQKPLPKNLIANADDLNQVLESSGLKIDTINGKNINTKYMNANNQAFVSAVTDSFSLISQYNAMPTDMKKLLAENGDVVHKLNTSRDFLNEYNALSPDMKKLIADTYGFDSSMNKSTGEVTYFNTVNPDAKQPIALTNPFNANMAYSTEMTKQLDRTNPSPKMPITNNNPFDAAFSGSIGWMNQYNNVFPNPKQPLAYTDAFNNSFSGAIGWMNRYNSTNPGGKTATVDSSSVSNAKGVFSDFMFNWNRTEPVLSKSIMFNVSTNKHARGTNSSPGGLSILGDGGRPEPFYMPKSGLFGISPAKDTPYMLEKGTKVWSSVGKFMRDMPSMAPQMLNALPHFAKGTPDIPADAEILRNINRAQTALTNQTINISGPDNNEVIRNQEVQIKIQQSQLDILHTLLNALTNQEPNSNLDLKQLAQMINATNQQSKQIIKHNNG